MFRRSGLAGAGIIALGRGRFKGGFSFVIWPRADGKENRFRPRLRIKSLNNRAALIEFGGTDEARHALGVVQGVLPNRPAWARRAAAYFVNSFLS